jgi:serine/threonine protein phosphatase 1
MKIFAMSDIHGSPVEFEEALELVDLSGDNLLILCGDYIHGYDSYTVLDRIIGLQNEYGSDKVIALMGK